MQENVASQASRIHAGGKIEPALGKLKEDSLARPSTTFNLEK